MQKKKYSVVYEYILVKVSTLFPFFLCDNCHSGFGVYIQDCRYYETKHYTMKIWGLWGTVPHISYEALHIIGIVIYLKWLGGGVVQKKMRDPKGGVRVCLISSNTNPQKKMKVKDKPIENWKGVTVVILLSEWYNIYFFIFDLIKHLITLLRLNIP